jgi:hypothetical protein
MRTFLHILYFSYVISSILIRSGENIRTLAFPVIKVYNNSTKIISAISTDRNIFIHQKLFHRQWIENNFDYEHPMSFSWFFCLLFYSLDAWCFCKIHNLTHNSEAIEKDNFSGFKKMISSLFIWNSYLNRISRGIGVLCQEKF